jgi:hypothetical protein
MCKCLCCSSTEYKSTNCLDLVHYLLSGLDLSTTISSSTYSPKNFLRQTKFPPVERLTYLTDRYFDKRIDSVSATFYVRHEHNYNIFHVCTLCPSNKTYSVEPFWESFRLAYFLKDSYFPRSKRKQMAIDAQRSIKSIV